MKITQYKKFNNITVGDIELIQQCFQRLAAECKITDVESFGEFLDVVLARDGYKDTSSDEYIDYDNISDDLMPFDFKLIERDIWVK